MGVYIGGAELRGMTFSPRHQSVVVTEFLWGVGAICGVNWQKRRLKEPESGEFVLQAGVRRARTRERRCASAMTRNPFNEDTRVKVPVILQLVRLGYTFLPSEKWDKQREPHPAVQGLHRRGILVLRACFCAFPH